MFNKQAELRCTEKINGPEDKEADSEATTEIDSKPIDRLIQVKFDWFPDLHTKRDHIIWFTDGKWRVNLGTWTKQENKDSRVQRKNLNRHQRMVC